MNQPVPNQEGQAGKALPAFFNQPIEIENIHVLRGANFFSGGPIIRFRINLGPMDEVFTDAIPGFTDKLLEWLPSLIEHHCSPGHRGGFILRLREGTLLGHVMEHVAIELQSLAGMKVGFGKTRMTKQQGVYNVVFRYADEQAGILAGKGAIHILNSLLQGVDIDLAEIVMELIRLREERLPGFSTQAILDEAGSRKIKTIRLDRFNLVQLGSGCYRQLIRATITGRSSLIAVETCDNKLLLNRFLTDAGIPVPRSRLVGQADEAIAFSRELGGPIVIKPVEGHLGKKVSLNLSQPEAITEAFRRAAEYDPLVMAQEMVPGRVFRLLVIQHQLVAAAELFPPALKGDGKSTLQELLQHFNADPRRETGDKGLLSFAGWDEEAEELARLAGLSPQAILPPEEPFILRDTGNLSTGGWSRDVTDEVDPWNRFLAERISRLIGLDVAGIDMIASHISQPLHSNGGVVAGVNAAPDFRMHIQPTEGIPRLVQKPFLDMLFPVGQRNSIPLISITGSNGKTELLNFISAWLEQKEFTLGLAKGNSLFIGNHLIKNYESPSNVEVDLILKDPTIDFAIFETPLEAILEQGLGYRFADIGIVLNLDESQTHYLKYDHIRDFRDVAYAKSVVAEEVLDQGYSILNAGCPLIAEMMDRLYSIPILFSTDYQNVQARSLAKKGGTAVLCDLSDVFIFTGGTREKFVSLKEIPFLRHHTQLWARDVVLGTISCLIALQAPQDEIKAFILSHELSHVQSE